MMRVLWCLNGAIGRLAQIMGKPGAQSGGWIDAQLAELERNNDVKLGVAATLNLNETKRASENNVDYYGLAGKALRPGAHLDEVALESWRRAIEEFKPDVLHFWGTEVNLALDLEKIVPSVPKVVTTQGVLRSLAQLWQCDKDESISKRELKNALSFPERGVYYLNGRRVATQMRTQAACEEQIVKTCDLMIVDPMDVWAESFMRASCEDVEFERVATRMNRLFRDGEPWKRENVEPYSIFCNAGDMPGKGQHTLVKALSVIRRRYPQAKLYIPGGKAVRRLGKFEFAPYRRYLEYLIAKYDLQDSVKFLGRLTAEEMAAQLRKAHLFVLASRAEHIPTSWREAMAVGTPCVLSQCGCVYEQVRHGEDAYMYRYGEYEVLAEYCRRIFESDEISRKFSENGKKVIERQFENASDDGADLVAAYRKALRKVGK
ncbi:MAG: glycosyltransferase family 4 protein [Thermoguttaceae bacterium]|nr:glycosyltransferase family 4 protein [Thermoguttaceae bacterium]